MVKGKAALPIKGIPIELSGELNPDDIKAVQGWDMESRKQMTGIYERERGRQRHLVEDELEAGKVEYKRLQRVRTNKEQSRAVRSAAKREQARVRKRMRGFMERSSQQGTSAARRAFRITQERIAKEKARQARGIKGARRSRAEFDEREKRRWERDFQ